MKAEVVVRRRSTDGKHSFISTEVARYAFTQHALRELRAHTSMLPVGGSAAKPSELDGRGGTQDTRASVSDIMQRQTCWPFHLAGDSGDCLFNHRSWLSWRFFALLELPFCSVHELPLTSAQLQSCIEAKRTNTPHSAQVDALAVEQILYDLFMMLQTMVLTRTGSKPLWG